jgi:putative acetyltransferase
MGGAAGRLRIRRGRPRDAASVAAVMRAAIRGLARGAYAAGELARWSSLPPLYHAWAMTAGGETYLLAERRGGVEGYAALRGREVTAVFVLPRSARRGLGRALVAAVERLARRRGQIALFARAALGAVPFYEAAGFRRGGAVRVPLPGGGHLRAVLVRKTLPRRGPTSARRGAGTGSAGTSRGRPAAGRPPPRPRSAKDPRARPASARSTRASVRGRRRASRGRRPR